MSRRVVVCCTALALVTFAVSCVKLPDRSGKGMPAPRLELGSTDEIPHEWGDLVSVTFNQKMVVFYLWFEDAEGNLRLAVFDANTQELWPTGRLLQRR